MKQQEWIHNVMDQLDPALVEEGCPAQKRRARPLRIALVAACACLVLVGGAFAAREILGVPMFTPVESSPVDGSAINGFTTVIQPPENGGEAAGDQTVGPFKLPVERYSQQLRDAAAALRPHTLGYKEFTSWDEAEKFLGIELLDNAVLDAAQPAGTHRIENGAHVMNAPFSVTYTAMEGVLTGAGVEAGYFLNWKDIYENGVLVCREPVRVRLMVQSYTKQSPIAGDEMFVTFAFPEDYVIAHEDYVTPGGLPVSIVCVSHPGGFADYYAQFVLNGSAVTVNAACGSDSRHALNTLKEILNGME